MSTPTVSIVVPTYNRALLLPRAIESIIVQTYDDWEIVLVDDGSTDDTESAARDYAQRLGDRFVYVRQDHVGCGSARNRGIDASRGRFVAFLDSDDEFLPEKLERQIELFHLRPELGLVYGDYAYIDLDGRRHESVFGTKGRVARMVPFENVGGDLCVCTGSLFDVLLKEYFIATIVGMVRREVLGGTIRFPSDPSYAGEWLFYLKVARGCRAGFVDAPLCLHHFVLGSATRTSARRNVLRLYELLIEMSSSFDRLNRAQRAAVDRNLSAAARQLGYDARRAGDDRAARRCFLAALHHRPTPGAVREAVTAVVRSWLPSANGGGRANGPVQDVGTVVR